MSSSYLSTQWRLLCHYSTVGPGNHIALATLEMHTSIGGADVCTGGTVSASYNGYPGTNAFDGNSSFSGQMDEFILTKGYADHTNTFTPPSTTLTSGTTGITEPTWNLSGTTTDSNITWTYIGPLVDPVSIGPKIPQ